MDLHQPPEKHPKPLLISVGPPPAGHCYHQKTIAHHYPPDANQCSGPPLTTRQLLVDHPTPGDNPWLTTPNHQKTIYSPPDDHHRTSSSHWSKRGGPLLSTRTASTSGPPGPTTLGHLQQPHLPCSMKDLGRAELGASISHVTGQHTNYPASNVIKE